MAVNLLSQDFGYPGLAAAAAIWAVVAAASRLRQFSAKVSLVSLIFWGSLAVAAAAAVVAAIATVAGWSAGESYATIISALFATVAIVVSSDLAQAFRLLRDVAAIGAGVVVLGMGDAALRHGDALFGITAVATGIAGIAFIVFGVASLRGAAALRSVVFIGYGAVLLSEGDVLYGIALIIVGIAVLRDGDVPSGIAGIAGVAFVGVGAASLRHGDVLSGITVIAAGIALVGAGITAFYERTGARVLAWLKSLTQKLDPNPDDADPAATPRQDDKTDPAANDTHSPDHHDAQAS